MPHQHNLHIFMWTLLGFIGIVGVALSLGYIKEIKKL